jgi:hypothetical protein
MTGQLFETIIYTCRLSRFNTRTRGYMLTNYGKIFTRSSVGYVYNRARRVDDLNDDNNRSSYAKDLMLYFRDDKGIDAQPGQLPEVDEEWENMGESLKKLNKKASRDYRLLEPGWAGDLEDDQVAYIRTALHDDPDLAYQWGFKRSSKRFSSDVIRRIALKGDANHRMVNVHLVKGQS